MDVEIMYIHVFVDEVLDDLEHPNFNEFVLVRMSEFWSMKEEGKAILFVMR